MVPGAIVHLKIYRFCCLHIKIWIKMQHHILERLFNFTRNLQSICSKGLVLDLFASVIDQGNRLSSQEDERYLEDVLVDKQFRIPVSLEVQGVLLRLRIDIPMVKVDDLQVSKVHFGFACEY